MGWGWGGIGGMYSTTVNVNLNKMQGIHSRNYLTQIETLKGCRTYDFSTRPWLDPSANCCGGGIMGQSSSSSLSDLNSVHSTFAALSNIPEAGFVGGEGENCAAFSKFVCGYSGTGVETGDLGTGVETGERE